MNLDAALPIPSRRVQIARPEDVAHELERQRTIDEMLRAAPFGGGLPIARASVLGLAGVFLPTTLSGCVMWLRSDLGITTVSGKVSVWADQSGSGNDVTQGTAGARPTYNTVDATFNSRPSLTFDGVDDNFQLIGFTLGAYTIFMLLTGIADSANNYFIYHNTDANNFLYLWASTGNSIDTARGGTHSSYNDNGGTPGTWGQWGASTVKTLRTQFDGTHAGHTLSLNNSAEPETTVGGSNPGTGTIVGSLNILWDGGATFAQTKLAELIIYNRSLSGGESTQVENYLRSLYAHY